MSILTNRTLKYNSGNDSARFDGLKKVQLIDSGGVNTYIIGGSSVSTAVDDSRLTLSGQNTVTVSGRSTAVDHSTLVFKSGGNAVSLAGSEKALSDSGLNFTGQGNDVISLSGKTVMKGSHLTATQGNNTITLDGTVALEKSSITTGSGSDTLSLSGAVKNSNINTGAGNDTVLLDGAISSSTLNTGAGNDRLVVSNSTVLQKGAVLIGGAGVDVMDIASRSSTSLETLVASGAQVKGVEIISMTGGKAPSTLEVSAAGLSRFTPDTLTNGLPGKSIMRVTGDADDKVSFASAEKWALASGAQTYSIDGVTYALWQNASGKQLLVQEGLGTTGGVSGSTGDGSGASGSGSAGNGSGGSGSSGSGGSGSGNGGSWSGGNGGSWSGGNGGSGGNYLTWPIIDNASKDYSSEHTSKTVKITGQSGVSMRDGSLALGGGNDTVILNGKMTASSIDMGEGHNSLHINAAVAGTAHQSAAMLESAGAQWSQHVSFSKITAGNGNDNVTINGRLDNGVDINLGNGANSLVLNNEAHYTRITGGSGKDSLVVKGLAEDIDVNLGDGYNNMTFKHNVVDSQLRSGSGSDSVTITGDLNGSSVSTGAGNDHITVWNVNNSNINLGAGHDSITVKGDFQGKLLAEGGNDHVYIGGALKAGSLVDLGDGNDSIVIKGMSGGVILGGAGTDSLTLVLDNSASPFGPQGQYSGMFSGGKSNARGFENLILDMEDKSAGELLLTQQQIDNLRKIGSANGADASAKLNIWIEGDAGAGKADSVVISGGQGEYRYSGSATSDGHTFDHYITDDGLDLFIQQGVLLNFA